MKKKVAIIGAGASGLTAMKCCLDEGIEPVCFERTDHIGGLWYYTETATDGQACVMKSTVINTCKEMTSFSDFPIPKECSIFMHNRQVIEYFQLYVDKFKLKGHIRFNTEVLTVKRCGNFATTGQWEVTTKDKSTGNVTKAVYDGILVCTGHHANVNMPKFPGMERFKGTIIHSHDYKHSQGLEDKRIVVVGIGNSAGDVAVELSRVASQVFMCTRRGAWVMNRVTEKGVPLGMNFGRFQEWLIRRYPGYFGRKLKEDLNKRFDHRQYALEPKHDVWAQHPTVNDDLPNRIVSGGIKIKPNMKSLTETGVNFEDGTFEDNIDLVILATGYVFGFPFLDSSVTEVKQNKVNLYKYMYPPELDRYTLAIIGCFQPLGSIVPVCEMQCRLATRVIKGDVTLPSRDRMCREIKKKHDHNAAVYVDSPRHTIQVEYIGFMDELAKLNGCKPNFCKLLLTDPKLAITCLFGPCTPYQFRITGPGAWSGARDAIMSQWDRNWYPLKTRPIPPKSESESSGLFNVLLIAVVGVIVYMLLFT